jgi:hypothetical protein
MTTTPASKRRGRVSFADDYRVKRTLTVRRLCQPAISGCHICVYNSIIIEIHQTDIRRQDGSFGYG